MVTVRKAVELLNRKTGSPIQRFNRSTIQRLLKFSKNEQHLGSNPRAARIGWSQRDQPHQLPIAIHVLVVRVLKGVKIY